MWRAAIAPILMDATMLDRLDRERFFRYAFSALFFNHIEGDYAEFGCHSGVTFSLAYRESRRFKYLCKLWAFDSFSGLPRQKSKADEHPEWIAGSMATSLPQFHKICDGNGIPRSAYETVPGFYDDTLGHMTPTDAPTSIALAYIDCDLYSSTMAVLRFLMPRLRHGMIIAFDDYYRYSATELAGDRRACLECFADNGQWNLIPYAQIGWFGMSYIVEQRDLLPASVRMGTSSI